MNMHVDAITEFAYNSGMDMPGVPWILTPFDVWVLNPHYTGKPVPHPDEAMFFDD